MDMQNGEVVFIPGPGIGHLVSAVEMGRLLISRDDRLSITFLIIDLPFATGINEYISSEEETETDLSRVRFIKLPQPQRLGSSNTGVTSIRRNVLTFDFISLHKPQAKEAIIDIIKNESRRVACIIVDMFSVSMIDLAKMLKLPSYVFFTSSAGFLGLLLNVFQLKEEHDIDITDYKDSDAELYLPCFINPLPAKVLPPTMVDKTTGGSEITLYTAKMIREATGVMVNTFQDLEPYAIQYLVESHTCPTIYPIGPLINSSGRKAEDDNIMKWLDKQPTSSVLLLCFGSYGYFNEDQVKEIAYALERTGCRFLWSLRQPRPDGDMGVPTGYQNPAQVLPEGFLDRTLSTGIVTGWIQQITVLSHPSIGGFVTHCGWNSILESIWFGVPMATWPMYAEQQFNAFEIVSELGLALNIKMEHKMDADQSIVTAEEIDRAIRQLMMDDDGDDKRKKMKDLQKKSHKALIPDGSSYNLLGHLVSKILQHISEKSDLDH